MAKTISLEGLLDSVGGTGVGIRSRIDLEPLGGPGDKLFPPTYGPPANGPTPETKYATENPGLLIWGV